MSLLYLYAFSVSTDRRNSVAELQDVSFPTHQS